MLHKTSEASNKDWLDLLQENGYRITAPRRAVVEVIAGSQYVLNPFEVYELARARYPRLGLVTVYRTIEKLEQAGLVQRVHQPSGCQGFITAFRGHQHLIICQGCGRAEIISVEDEHIDSLMAEVERQSGFDIQGHWLQFFGFCAACNESGHA